MTSIDKILQTSGLKITAPRRLILKILEKNLSVLSAYEIQKKLQKEKQAFNISTIYRVLQVLCSLGLIHKIVSLNGFKICQFKKAGGCHHFLLCDACGDIREIIEENHCQAEKTKAEKLGFSSKYHINEMIGLCNKCNQT